MPIPPQPRYQLNSTPHRNFGGSGTLIFLSTICCMKGIFLPKIGRLGCTRCCFGELEGFFCGFASRYAARGSVIWYMLLCLIHMHRSNSGKSGNARAVQRVQCSSTHSPETAVQKHLPQNPQTRQKQKDPRTTDNWTDSKNRSSGTSLGGEEGGNFLQRRAVFAVRSLGMPHRASLYRRVRGMHSLGAGRR